MPCKGGYRVSIEEGKRYIRAERERRLTDPYRKLWVSLVEKVYQSPTGFDGLSHPQKLYFAVGLLEGDVYNGGFHQYFFNDSGSYYAYAEEGLIAVGIPDARTIAGSQRDAVPWRPRPCKNSGAATFISFPPGGKFFNAQVERKTGRP